MDFLTFIIILSVLIIVHEWGHYITARKLGIRVERFSVGFGQKLVSWKMDGTEFMICAIPLGGYVKMAGDERDKTRGKLDEYYSHPVGHRALVVLMGPVVNFLFAYICLYVIFLTGFPAVTPTVGKVLEKYPAQEAGIVPGDRILRINGQPMESFEAIQEYVMTSSTGSLSVDILRQDQHLTKTVTTKRRTIHNIFGQVETVSFIGIQPKEEVIYLKYGLGKSFIKAADQLWMLTVMMYKAIYHVVTGAMPAKDALGGPVRIFQIIKEAVERGLSYVIFITAVISANLALFNLFPIPVLDGGHLLFMAIEKLRGRPLPLKVEEGFTKAGLSLLLVLVVFVFYNDIVQVGWVDNLMRIWQKFHNGGS